MDREPESFRLIFSHVYRSQFPCGVADCTSVNTSAAYVDHDQQIAHLHAQLQHALHRANVAEEQLRRVHAAVRAFKERQLAAKHAAHVAAVTASANVNRGSWVAEDPSLDIRFQEFLDGESGEDAARKWILADD